MSTKDYIKQLKKNLSKLDRKKTDEIIKEIESYIQESNANIETLIEKFGTADELANNYLEDMPIKVSSENSFWMKTKKIVGIVSVTVLVLIAIASYTAYKFTHDSFDYSTYNATSIVQKVDELWLEADGITSIKAEQAEIVFYWGNTQKLKYNCKGIEYSKKESVFTINQARCFIILPMKAINISSFQAEVILIAPTNNVNLDLKQSSSKIAEMGNAYTYNISSKQSKVENFSSKPSDVTLSMKVYQGKIKHYKY